VCALGNNAKGYFSKQREKVQGDIGYYTFICEWADVSSISVGIVILCDVH
jgi:hypothetical protein